MKRNSILLTTLLSVMAVSLAQGATLRYQGSGDYTNILAIHGTLGWYDPAVPGSPTTLPGSADTIRANYGNNTITLTTVAPDVARFQLGVDESGTLVVESGGSLAAVGTSANRVGNNGGPTFSGQMIVYTNGVVNSRAVLEVGSSANGILTLDGGTLNQSNHLWIGSANVGAVGTVNLTNGGVLNMLGVGGNGMIGLGTINATSASGENGFVNVSDGGVLNLYNISSGSIQPGSRLDITGSGVVTIPGNRVSTISTFTNAARITAYGGAGTVGIDYNNTNVGKTTLWAIAPPAPPPTNCTWTATSGTGLWNVNANWECGVPPLSLTKANFNVPGAIPCTVATPAVADYVVMGENGPGGTLIITNGGSLACGVVGTNVIGLNSNALMVVENGGSAAFGAQLRIGLDPDSDGTLVMNGGTVSVAGMFDLGGQGGKGTAQIKGGTLNLSQFDDYASIQGASVLDVSGTGKVVINGDHQLAANYYISTGQITNSVGTNLLVDYNIINVGKTTIYPFDLYLPPAQVVWNPAANPSTTGLWDECANWTTGLCPGNVTFVTFNVPDAIPCTVTNAALAGVVRMGNSGGPGGTLIITNGGSLTCAIADEWNGIAYSSNALMVVENGASVSFAYHLWIGFNPDSDGTLTMNGGTVSVGGQFGLGWNGGKGTAQINVGTLNLSNLHPTDSIKGSSVLNLTGTGTVLITGNHVTPVGNYISAGKITANGGSGVVAYGYDSSLNKTILQVAPPRQSITGAAVSGGNVTITCQTTPGHFYHIESSTNVSPTAWTRVAGTTTNATGASATLTFPASGDQRFYRTVSP